MSEFRVQKIRQQMEITLVTGERLAGVAFLEPVARLHTGPQDPVELLNDPEAFFPVEVGGGLTLIAKDQVRIVRYPRTGSAQPAPDSISVRVIMADGGILPGVLLAEKRSGADRLLDRLNNFEGRFLPMITEQGRFHCLVNRRMIVGVQQ